MSAYTYRVEKIRMKCGTEIEPKRITVFVGPNNCGKTRTLRDVYGVLTGLNRNTVTVESVEVTDPASWEEMAQTYHMKIEQNGNSQQLRFVSPTLDDNVAAVNATNAEAALTGWLKSNICQFREATGKGLVMFLNTDNRLSLAKSRPVSNLNAEGPKSILEVLFKAGAPANQSFVKCIQEVFGTDILLDTSNLGRIQFRTDKKLSHISKDPLVANGQLEGVPLLDAQGDGLRSFVGIAAALIATDRPVVLLDEPEAFLHPPQAYQMGQRISGLIGKEKQVFIATHSADFLRGLLASGAEDAMIVRLSRTGTPDDAMVLDPDTLHKIVTDPMLSSSRVLEGMFYRGVVATEADSDTTFYQRLLMKRDAVGEIHFVSAYGKQALKKLIDPYQKLGVRYAVITDADVIRDKNEFKQLIEICPDPAIRAKILGERDHLYQFFQSKSKYQLLSDMRQQIADLGQAEIPPEDSDETTITGMIDEFRTKLKHIRDDSDELKELKRNGRMALPEQSRKLFDDLYEDCAEIGLFIVPVGELESWLQEYEVPPSKHKSAWISRALEKLDQIEYDKDKELWKFIDKIYAKLS